MNVSVKVDIDPKRIANKYTDDKIGKYVSSVWARYMDKYVPYDTGMLSANVDLSTPFQVKYTQPYAHRIYEGEGFDFSKEHHPLASAHWDKTCENAQSTQIAKEIEAYLR